MTENQQNPEDHPHDRNSATDAAPGRDRSDLLAKNWQPGEVEKALYDAWEAQGYFRPDEDADKPAYSVVLPPPNVTGQLHMGHALDHTLMDSIIRRKRMQGFSTLWLPGSDHAGIATQTKVEAKLREQEGKSRWDYSREDFITGMPASTSALMVGAISTPPSILTACTPASFINRTAVSTAWAGEVS